jgi:hypothetical protein
MTRKTATDFFSDDESTEEQVKHTGKEKQEKEKQVGSDKNKNTDKDEKQTVVSVDNTVVSKDTTTTAAATTTELTPEQVQYMQYYQQYQQQYQQYYAQAQTQTQVQEVQNDPVYELYSSGASSSTTPAGASFDAGRASRQMAAYFDPTKFNAVLSPEMQAAQQAQKTQQQARLTAKQIEAFKKRKIEKKKGKNRWFYE